MTEDYKKTLINYVTNNLEEGTPTNEEIIKEINFIDTQKFLDFDIRLRNNQVFISGIINLDEKYSNLKVIYGGYRQSMNDNTGFILICDGNFNPLQLIDTYDNGTPCRPFWKIIQDEDGTFYGIDHSLVPNTPSQIRNADKRFIMLNNFLINLGEERKLILRKSYNVPEAYKDTRIDKIFKNPNSADYVFCGAAGSTLYYSTILTFKINVGSSNEWNYYTSTYEYAGSYVEFDNENNAYIEVINTHTSAKTINRWYKDYNSSTFSNQTLYTFTERQDLRQAEFVNKNEFYFVTSPRNYYDNMHLMVGHYVNGTTNFIFDYNYGSLDDFYNQARWISLQIHQGKLYYVYTEIPDLSIEPNYSYNVYIQRYEGIWNPIKIIDNNTISNYNGFTLEVMNNYNLLTIFIYPDGFLTSFNELFLVDVKEIYNQNQYNGEPYSGVDALVPLYSNLYSGESLIFSRNLYNVTKQNNQTTSSVEIPNTYLNDINISQKDLISNTNFQMNRDLTNWNKNIYEVVDMNFINTISIIDEDTNTPYFNSAIKVNNAITDGGNLNYQNTPITKVRVNYTDSTTSIINIYWNSIDDTHKETSFNLYVDKDIFSIDFISNDETTIYLTKEVDLEVGKTYSISQKIRID